MPEIIQLPIIDIIDTQTVKSFFYSLVLDDDYIQILEKSVVNNKNEDTGLFNEEKVDSNLSHLKRFVTGVQVLYNSPSQKYFCKIVLVGASYDWNIYYNSKKEATELRDKILTWLLK